MVSRVLLAIRITSWRKRPTAWKRWRRRFQPDVIVSDINMPAMDGLALLRKVNDQPEPPLVILITAYGSEAVAMEALRAGAYNYLPKPFELDELRAIVRNAVEKQQLLQENRRINAELRRTIAELRQSQAELVQAKKMAALSGLVAGVAHEINTPLGALQSSADTLVRAMEKLKRRLQSQASGDGEDLGPLPEVIEAAAAQSRQACHRIAGIVTNLERFAQLDRADFRHAQLHEGLDSAVNLLRHRMEDRIDLVTDFGDLPEIDCHPRDLNQVFLNLLQNAVEAIEQDSGRGEIRLKTRREGDWIRIAVSDNGCGVPPEHLQSLFDPGFTSKGVKVGTGLGLAICYQIVQAHHGRIEVDSRIGEGSTFTVFLPLTRRE